MWKSEEIIFYNNEFSVIPLLIHLCICHCMYSLLRIV